MKELSIIGSFVTIYFPIAVIKLSESKVPEKICKFETLHFRKSVCDKSESYGDNKP